MSPFLRLLLSNWNSKEINFVRTEKRAKINSKCKYLYPLIFQHEMIFVYKIRWFIEVHKEKIFITIINLIIHAGIRGKKNLKRKIIKIATNFQIILNMSTHIKYASWVHVYPVFLFFFIVYCVAREKKLINFSRAALQKSTK